MPEEKRKMLPNVYRKKWLERPRERAERDGARMGRRVTVEESRDTFEMCLSHSELSLQESKIHGKETLFFTEHTF